jgi:hypothetical protein
MRIGPAATFPDSLENFPNVGVRSLPRQPSVPVANDASSEKTQATKPDQQAASTQPSTQNQQAINFPQFPEDDVQVQFDRPMNDDILIYQFLNKRSGDLVRQVPSTQVLNVIHQIQNELQQDSSAPAEQVPQNINPGDTTHGN